jgi:hypothetical protein
MPSTYAGGFGSGYAMPMPGAAGGYTTTPSGAPTLVPGGVINPAGGTVTSPDGTVITTGGAVIPSGGVVDASGSTSYYIDPNTGAMIYPQGYPGGYVTPGGAYPAAGRRGIFRGRGLFR